MISKLYTFLLNHVADRGLSSMRAVADFARENRDLELKSPALAALVCWGEPGLHQIRDIAVAHPTSKNVSASLKILSGVASGDQTFSGLMFIHDDRLAAIMHETLLATDLRVVARQQLNDLVLSLPPDELLIPLGTAFTQISLGSADSAGEIVSSLSAKWLRFGPPALTKYEDLLLSSPSDEPAFHQFFVEFPQLLEPMATTVWSKPDFHGALEPDFVIRRSDNTYLIVEIECPSKSLVTIGRQLTADVTQAERQGTEYRTFLTERLQEAQRHFPFISDPDCLIVIGFESSLDEAQRKVLANANGSRYRLRVVGFDWLLERARAILANVSTGKIEVLCGHRMI